MTAAYAQGLLKNFLGNAPYWYKYLILLFLIINPVMHWLPGPWTALAGWVLLAQFIFTLAMALKCYPLLPGGLLALQAVALGMTSPEMVLYEVRHNLEVILLLMFMVAGIYFMKQLLLFVFTKMLVGVRSKSLLSFIFCAAAALLSAFLDALTVTAVIISIAVGFYSVYHRVASGQEYHQHSHDHGNDLSIIEAQREDLEQFRGFLRSLLMHGAIGTALGGVATMVGEPQNLLIAKEAGWGFSEFFREMAPVSLPVLVAGLFTCLLLEKVKPLGRSFGYAGRLPGRVRAILEDFDRYQTEKRTPRETVQLLVQAVVAVFLVLALAFHVAEVGLIGLAVIVLLTSLNGINEEHQIGKAFQEALPFTGLLVVFFTIVAVIHSQQMFQPFIEYVLSQPLERQPGLLYFANGLLSAISDNVFVATVYIGEVKAAFLRGDITREHFELLAIAINTGTNLPSVATPNGQAAFLFLLTSAIAPLVRLSYGRMVLMAMPYTLVMGGVGFWAVTHWL
ncbi:sodium/proton antiporter NhaB [Marinospirillum alkaliphilum]|uniref:Na(+)/H(+) antiporter NhaB n=1 Tax=Marinospirillum alkaliphilum DSM 21637 TaxID=1122209 RepID=A0A1K1VJK8_9GAMM|nr:sodium/proton antiporter NhaB [Marinospirillum alkaliphilum]SFX25322.1 Na+:H+ antiporter, NhaB family [Marinospirillum alkaliphilum DSM 21637]